MEIVSVSDMSAHPEFEYLKVTRSGGFAGFVDSVHLDRELRATVHRQIDGGKQLQLDAREGEELMEALQHLMATAPGTSRPRGADTYHYDIELCWNGNVTTVHVDQLAVDEAVRGVLSVAVRLLDDAPASSTV